MSRKLTILLLAVLALTSPARARDADEADPGYGFYWFPPSAYWDDWVFLAQPYWSGLDGFGVGLEVTRPFTVPLFNGSELRDSELAVDGRLYEDMHGSLTARAEMRFDGGTWTLIGNLHTSTRLRRFWGVGPVLDHENREVFRPQDLRSYVELLRRFGHWRAGPRVEIQDYAYHEIEPDGLLASGAYPGVSAGGETVHGVGLIVDRDSRDDRYNPRNGWWIQAYVMRLEHYANPRPQFWNTYLDVRNYQAVSDDDVVALQAFLFGVGETAPVWRYAAMGGREHTRGYSRNRYLDRKMVAVQVEWRRPLLWRFDVQVFTGAAIVAGEWDRLVLRHTRPTFGAGLSIPIPQVSSIPVRGDLAIGDESLHGDLSIGFAF